MRIQDVMSRTVVSVPQDMEVATARERLKMEEIDHLVVADGDRVVGIVAGRDVVRVNDHKTVADVMSRDVVTVAPDATLRRAAGVMRGRSVGCLPVLDDGHLVGIVTTSDLLTALAKGEVHAAPPSDRIILRKRGPRKRGHPI